MDIDQVARVVELVENSQLHEVTIANNGRTITVVNSLGLPSSIDAMPTDEPEQKSSKVLHVCAPYVGQIHLSEDDTTDNLVNIGDHIQKGQTVCFIEELTRLLPIISDKEGVVEAVLVKNGQNVEYGQAILALATSP